MALDEEKKRELHQLHLNSRALLESLADRLPEQRLTSLRRSSKAGEWTLLMDAMCASLVKRQIPITPAERNSLAEVLAVVAKPTLRPTYKYLQDVDETLAALNVVG